MANAWLCYCSGNAQLIAITITFTYTLTKTETQKIKMLDNG